MLKLKGNDNRRSQLLGEKKSSEGTVLFFVAFPVHLRSSVSKNSSIEKKNK